MKAIIAAGGHGTRIRPITWTLNKHLIPLANKPMIVHAIEKIRAAGLTDIYININPGDKEMEGALGDGSRFGVQLHYIEQKGGAKGVAHIPKNAQKYLANEPFLFYLGDNIILGELDQFVKRFKQENLDCLLAFAKVKNPTSFGVPEFASDGSLKQIIEKPKNPPSDFAVTGIYIFNQDYFNAFDQIKPSARGEYEITDIGTWFIKNNKKVGYEEITGWWKDTGKPNDLLEGNALLLDQMTRGDFVIKGDIDPQAKIQGLVSLGTGSSVGKNTLIRGPVTIGKNCSIENSYVGPYTSIGNNVSIKNAEIEHSIILDDSLIASPQRLIDSIVGREVSIVAHGQTKPTSGHQLIVGDRSQIEL